MTNYDRIKAMSINEMAYFISEMTDNCEKNTSCNQYCYGCAKMLCVCENCLEWLQQEATE